MKNDTTKNLLVKGITIGSAFLLKKTVESFIENTTAKNIPKKPDKENDETWTQAIAYAAFSGAFLGAFKLIIERTADNKLDKLL